MIEHGPLRLRTGPFLHLVVQATPLRSRDELGALHPGRCLVKRPQRLFAGLSSQRDVDAVRKSALPRPYSDNACSSAVSDSNRSSTVASSPDN
jgi:hypothetical protein